MIIFERFKEEKIKSAKSAKINMDVILKLRLTNIKSVLL